VPLAQGSLGAVPPAQWVPTSQDSHTGADVAIPALVCTVPAGHAPAGRHVLWFGDQAYVPSTQGAHCRSAILLPGLLTWLPGEHVVQGVQLSAFSVALKVPLPQTAHVRSEVAEGAFVTYVPGSHVDHGTHPLSSQIPSPQVLGALPPSGLP